MPDRERPALAPKPPAYLPVYEELIGHLRRRPFKLLELGVWEGDSLRMWRACFPRASIVGVDLEPPDLDLGGRVALVAGDQGDAELMARITRQYAPGGWDVVIDDASHVGVLAARSLQALYREHLKPGGVYVIEDWGTGYWPDFYDGGRLAEPLSVERLHRGTAELDMELRTPVPMPSHDVGSVGLVKRLIDHMLAPDLAAYDAALVDSYLPIDSVRIEHGLVALTKPAAG